MKKFFGLVLFGTIALTGCSGEVEEEVEMTDSAVEIEKVEEEKLALPENDEPSPIKRGGNTKVQNNSSMLDRVEEGHNELRTTHVNSILNGVWQYSLDNRGKVPPGIDSAKSEVGSGKEMRDICEYLVPTYLANMPMDPSLGIEFLDCNDYQTGYLIYMEENGRVTVSAPLATGGETISVTR